MAMLVRAAVTMAILGYLGSRIDLRDAFDALIRVDPLLLFGTLLLVAVDRAVMVWRWLILLRAAAAPVSILSATRIFLTSSFVGSFLPAGVGADAARAYALARRTAQHSEAVASVAVDRLLGLMSIVLLGAAGMAAWTGRMDAATRRGAIGLALVLAAVSTAVLWADRVTASALAHRAAAGGQVAGDRRWLSRPIRLLWALAEALGRYRGRRLALAIVLVLSIAVQLLRVTQAYLLGRGLGLQVPYLYYLVFMPAGLLMLLLPVSISGFGLPQGVIVWLLRPVGVADTLSFALSTLIVLTGLAGNLPGAWLYLRGEKPLQ